MAESYSVETRIPEPLEGIGDRGRAGEIKVLVAPISMAYLTILSMDIRTDLQEPQIIIIFWELKRKIVRVHKRSFSSGFISKYWVT